MATRPKITIQDIIALKKENENLECQLNMLQLERFDYALKVNNLERILANVEAVSKTQSSKLLECLEHLCTVLQVTKSDVVPSNVQSPLKTLESPQQHSTPNKAHIVKPHMVNGHVLYRPTINLTRVSDVPLRSQRAVTPNNEDDDFNENDDNTEQGDSDTENSHEDENIPLSLIEEEDELQTSNRSNRSSRASSTHEASSSRSPPHSTVLSGTFQEVKIYLNQISDGRVETSRSSRGSKTKRRHTGNTSNKTSLDENVTTRRKRTKSE